MDRTRLVVLCLSLSLQAYSQSVPSSWKVRSVSLVPPKAKSDDGRKCTLQFERDTLLGLEKKVRAYDIPVASITALAQDDRIRNRAAAYAESGGGCDGMGCAFNLAAMGLLAPFHVHWKYLSITWLEGGNRHLATFRFPRDRFPTFLAEITQRTGLECRDLAQERDKILLEIERRKDEGVALEVGRGMFIRKDLVPKGRYQLLLLDRAPNEGELYLFRGRSVDPKKLKLVVPVDILQRNGALSEASLEATPLPRWGNKVTTVHLAGKTLRIPE